MSATGTFNFGAAGGVASGLGSLVSGIGTFFGDQATAQGDTAAATSFGQEAQILGEAAQSAQSNEKLSMEAAKIQEIGIGREVKQTLGTQNAIEGAAGFDVSQGSGYYLMRSSMQQGALAKGIVQTQGEINAGGYAEQVLGLQAQQQGALGAEAQANAAAQAAQAGGISGLLGGILGAAAHVIPFL